MLTEVIRARIKVRQENGIIALRAQIHDQDRLESSIQMRPKCGQQLAAIYSECMTVIKHDSPSYLRQEVEARAQSTELLSRMSCASFASNFATRTTISWRHPASPVAQTIQSGIITSELGLSSTLTTTSYSLVLEGLQTAAELSKEWCLQLWRKMDYMSLSGSAKGSDTLPSARVSCLLWQVEPGE